MPDWTASVRRLPSDQAFMTGDQASIPTAAPRPAATFDSTQQNFIASGATTAPGEQLNTNGQPLSAEQRAQIPDFVLQDLINTGVIPAMAEGGLFNNGMVSPFADRLKTQQGFQQGTDAIQRYQQSRPAPPQSGNGSFGGGTGGMPAGRV